MEVMLHVKNSKGRTCGTTGIHSRKLLKKSVQQGRSQWKHRRRSFFHPPTPSCQDSLFSEWATLRMLSRGERSMGKGASRRARVGRVRRAAFSAA